ncbi:MAG: hypothetical protein HFF87_04150 [Oscillibacter sp.]|nr:hypothetical protein [Oscillibacter sp.]
MANCEALIRSILGVDRSNLRPLIYAVEITSDLLFVQHIAMDDLYVTKNVYPEVARRMNKSASAAARQVERLANRCWDVMSAQSLAAKYIGKELVDIHAPSDMLTYLAFYLHFERPFFEVIEQEPSLLF